MAKNPKEVQTEDAQIIDLTGDPRQAHPDPVDEEQDWSEDEIPFVYESGELDEDGAPPSVSIRATQGQDGTMWVSAEDIATMLRQATFIANDLDMLVADLDFLAEQLSNPDGFEADED